MPLYARLTGGPRDVLRSSPAALPCCGALALFVIWAVGDAGYPVTHWGPGGLVLLLLLAIALYAAPLARRTIPVPVQVAAVCLALFTALSYLSILWAQVPGDAWEGANRTLVYLLVFCLFALWPQNGRSGAVLLSGWSIAMVGLAVFVLLHVESVADPARLFNEGRLKYPADYENACAAVWCMVLWPTLLLSASRWIPWALRGVLGGGTVLLADVALLSQSRGSLYATVVMLILAFALVPNRVRNFVVLVPVALGIGLTARTVLHVGDTLQRRVGARALPNTAEVHSALHSATAAILLAAIAVGAVVGALAAFDSRGTVATETRAVLHRAIAAVAVAALVLVLAGGWIAAGNPIARAEHGWQTFKGGYSADNANVNRLISGLGSGRYDFYRVALDEFVAHPIVGIGADNFAEQYLARGHAEQSPHYPHSIEIRTLSQTGILGSLLALVGLGAALLACWRAVLSKYARRADPLAAAVAAAALSGFAYWLVHGSFDWLWEFAGLGAPAFALLGLTCALAPRPAPALSRAGAGAGQLGTATAPRRSPLPAIIATPVARLLAIAALVVVALVAAASLATPWLSQLEVQKATRIWPTAPREAYSELDDAARLNPLADDPYLLAGSIALRFGDLTRADHEFVLALGRDHNDAYATLERGAIASARGERARALALLERTERLNPHEELIRELLAVVRKGERISIERLDRAILLKAQRLA
jgi:tetratricopeptide (TPR) repeat protein